MIDLRDYQEEAVSFFYDTDRAILADEPGLGKTYPAIHAAAEAPGPRLVVAPPYLLRQWEQAIRDYLGDVPITVLHRRDPPIPDDYDGWVVTGYHTLMTLGVRKHPELLSRAWSVAIFDEAHRLRGRKSQWTKTAFKLKADRLWLLTGTPVVNHPGDLWPLLHLLDPKTYRGYWKFVGEWCETEQTPWATVVHGLKPGSEEAFRERVLGERYLRRRIADHLPDLPPVIAHRVPVDLPPATRAAHDRAKRDYFLAHPDLDDPVAVLNGGALIAKLRQLTAGFVADPETGAVTRLKERPKVEAVAGIAEDHPTEPLVVFCWYVETARAIAEALDGTRGVWCLTGRLSAEERAQAVRAWQGQPAGVIVATLAALTEGANLQHARCVVFAEHDYLPATIEQATARVRRFGQQYPVNCYHVYAARSVDEAVLRAMGERGGSIRRALEVLRDGEDSVRAGVPERLALRR